MKKIFIISIFLFIVDQISKYFVFVYNVNKSIIPNFLHIKLMKNKGISFSMLYGMRILIIIFTILIFLFVIYSFKNEYFIKRKYKKTLILTYSFLISGMFGNFFDRLFRGYVIDFISVKIFNYYFPVFNLSDILITLSVLIILFYTIFIDRKKES